MLAALASSARRIHLAAVLILCLPPALSPAAAAQETRPATAPATRPADDAPQTQPAPPETQPAQNQPAETQDSQTPDAQTQPATDTAPATAPARERITEDVLYGPDRVDFDGSYATGMTWLGDGRHFLHRRDGILQRVDALTDEATPFYDVAALEQKLIDEAELDADQAQRLARQGGEFSRDRSAMLLSARGRRFVYRPANRELIPVELPRGAQEIDLSPTGRRLSFVHKNDLHTLDLASGRQAQLTRDGSDTLLNGILDWVYQEEVYGRGNWRAYWWSDDERHLAFLQLDESSVPVYTIIDHVARPQRLERMHYPKAGEPNPPVRLGIVPAAGGPVRWADLSAYADTEILIVRVAWSPDHKVIFQVQDREQTWLDLCEADPAAGSVRVLVRERSPAWVNVIDHPHWLPDGTFLWRSERDGWQHIYHYARDGRLIRRVTQGDWDVRDLYGADLAAGRVYFSASADSPIQTHAYRAALSGGPPVRLTQPGFTHRTSFEPRLGLFIDTFSNLLTPPRVELRAGNGDLVRVISENPVDRLRDFELGESRFLRIPARDGHLLNALLILPPDYQPGRRYPVWCPVYAGPAAPTVSDSWGGQRFLYNQMLAGEGIIVWSCDPRSASNNGALSAWHAYQRLGAAELADIEDGVRWLIERGYADPERVGISGGSYGGYMVAYALTHSRMFSVGVSAFPVTDWHFYDTIYTERYMRRPQNNPEGYKLSSAIEAAGELHGKLLIYHGMIDDNVHVHNTIEFIYHLQRAGKQFELMLYPLDRHGIGRGARHLRELSLDFIRENL